ncbi:ras-related protein RABA1f [Trifolium repens]|nr:ras-related protein RABA1f [Trifolium repens]
MTEKNGIDNEVKKEIGILSLSAVSFINQTREVASFSSLSLAHNSLSAKSPQPNKLYRVRIQRLLQHSQAEQHPDFFTADTSSRAPTLIVCPLGKAAGSSPISRAFLLTTR